MRSIRGKISLAALVLMGCREPIAAPIPAEHPDDPTPRRGGTLHLATTGDIRGLDPAAHSDQLSGMIGELLFAGLIDVDTKGNVVPDIATHWDVSADGRTYTFFLRPNVRFHDGEEVTADDVKRSVERAFHPTTPNPMASFYDSLVGFEEYTTKNAPHLTGVEVQGRYAVAFRLKRRDSVFLPLMTMLAMRPVCKSAGERYADTWHVCGAGPFKLQPGGWDRGRSITVVRHEGYFRPGTPYLDAVTYSYGMTVFSQRFAFEAGKLDVFRESNQADASLFRIDPRWRGMHGLEPSISIAGEVMNTELPPFDNVEVRRAVSSAIDRDHYRILRASNVTAHPYPVPADTPGFNPNVPGQRFDLEEALEHMKKAGYPYDPKTGRGGYPHPIEYITYRPGFPEYTAQVLKEDLARIGLRIDVKVVNYATYLQLIHRRRRTAMVYGAWSQDYPDALDFYESLFTSKQINDEESTNIAFYNNPVFDDVVARAREELDPSARQALLDRAGAIVRDDAPWAFTYSYRFFNVRQPYVRNFATHRLWMFNTREMWLDRAKSLVALGTWNAPLRRGERMVAR